MAVTISGPLTGSTLGNYVLADLLDEGGVGSVYVAEHRFFGEKAAVKVLQQQPANSNAEEIAARFFQEARATRSIDHPNVIRVHDFGQSEAGILYLAMELLEGVSIAHVLERGIIEERSAAFIAAAVANGLEAAHQKGIIHRDLKPANLFLCANSHVKLLDFGMAKVKESKVRTGVGMLAGTAHYMSPEQIRQEEVGPRADIYGLGAVLFKMLTGRLPFHSENLLEIVRMHLNDAPPRPSDHAPVSARMDEIVLACLDKDPARRPASMAELRELLRTIADQLGPQTATHDATSRVELTPSPATAQGLQALARAAQEPSKAPPPPSRAPRRLRWGALAAITLSCFAVGAAMALLGPSWHGRRQPGGAASRDGQVATAVARSAAVTAPPPAPAAAAPAPEPSVNVETDPPGADVFADHVRRGVAPLDLTVPLPVEIKVTMTGYRTIRRKIARPGPVRIKLVPEVEPQLPRLPGDEAHAPPPAAPETPPAAP